MGPGRSIGLVQGKKLSNVAQNVTHPTYGAQLIYEEPDFINRLAHA